MLCWDTPLKLTACSYIAMFPSGTVGGVMCTQLSDVKYWPRTLRRRKGRGRERERRGMGKGKGLRERRGRRGRGVN